MAAVNDQGSPKATTNRLHLLLNFCRTVVRSDDHLLQLAMAQYQQELSRQQPAR